MIILKLIVSIINFFLAPARYLSLCLSLNNNNSCKVKGVFDLNDPVFYIDAESNYLKLVFKPYLFAHKSIVLKIVCFLKKYFPRYLVVEFLS